MTSEKRSAADIEHDIAQTRHQIDNTIDEIKRRLSPDLLVDQATTYLRGTSGDLLMNVGQTLKDYPVPLALISLGLGWMLVKKSMPTVEREAEEPSEFFDATTAWEPVEKAKERYEGVSDQVAEAIDHFNERRRAMADEISSRAAEAMEATKATAQQHPLMLGAIGIAVGAAFALMLPRTRMEDGTLGKLRDDVVEGVKETGKETLRKAKEVAGDAWESAKQTVAEDIARADVDPAGRLSGAGSATSERGFAPDPAKPRNRSSLDY